MFYHNRPYVSPFNNSLIGLYRPTMESSSSQYEQYEQYSPLDPTQLDMNFEELMYGQEQNYTQDYSMGHGSGQGSAPGSTHGSVRFNDEEEEDDSPVEETLPVKVKKPSKRGPNAKKGDKKVKEMPKEWTMQEEMALYQGWCDVSENNITVNSQKVKGFWEAVIKYYEVETGSTRGYDAVVSKWKNMIRPRIGAFSAIIKHIEGNHESGTNDPDVSQKACAEFKILYKSDFTLSNCYAILKDHQGWQDIEVPKFSETQRRKKSKNSETTLGSASGVINLKEGEAKQEYSTNGS